MSPSGAGGVVTDSQTQWPTVSVIVPCKNAGNYVGEAVESVLAQSRPVTEIIVIDDGSTDHTMRVLGSFGDRVRVLVGPGSGPSSARNMGMRAARGEYVAFLDADDMWYPNKMEMQLAQMRRENARFSFTDYHHSEHPSSPGDPA